MKTLRAVAFLVIVGSLAGAALAVAAGSGISKLHARSKSHTFTTNGERASVKPSCSGSQQRVSGGFRTVVTPDNGPAVSVSKTSARGWTTTGDEYLGLATGSDKLTGSVYCAKRAPAIRTRRSSKTVPSGKGRTVVARCPSGTRAIAGGFKTRVDYATFEGVLVDASRRAGARAWKVHGGNVFNADPGKLTAYAYCARTPKLISRSTAATASNSHLHVAMKPKCPNGSRAISGGFSSALSPDFAGGNFISASQRAGKRGWSVRALYGEIPGGGPAKETAYVYCAK